MVPPEKRPPRTPKLSEINFDPEARDRFERAVDAAAKSGPVRSPAPRIAAKRIKPKRVSDL